MSSFLRPEVSIQKVRITMVVFFGLLVFHVGIFVFAKNQDTDNLFQDTDQDGLSNQEEKAYGTDLNNPDTDGDGFTDGAEIKSGYDPTKPAPGDKLVSDNASEKKSGRGGDAESLDTSNLTEQVSTQISALLQSSSDTNSELSSNDISSKIEEILNQQDQTIELPEIDLKSIKIKKQDYKNLSETERENKIKQDTLTYASSVSYIIANNSPMPIQGQSDIPNIINSLTQQSIQATTSRDFEFVDDIEKRGQDILKQLEEIEVPENMLDTHVKALQIANYAITIKQQGEDTDPNDPLANIYALSKAQALLGIVTTFATDIESTLAKYGVTDVSVLNQ